MYVTDDAKHLTKSSIGCKSNKNAKVTRFCLDGCMLLTKQNT